MFVSKSDSTELRSVLAHRGYVVLDGIDDTQEHLNLASKFGRVEADIDGSLIKRLIVRDRLQSNGPSLSAAYGREAFPYHTDTASWHLPVQLLSIRAVGGDLRRGTRIIAGSELFADLPRSEIGHSCWAVVNGRNSFYCGLSWGSFGESQQVERYRVDLACMSPVNKSAKLIAPMIRDRCNHEIGYKIEWQPGRVLILDNWRMLHARCSPVMNEGERVLERIYIKNEF